MQPQESMLIWSPHRLLVDPDCTLSSVTGLNHCIHLQPATPSVHLYASGPTPITGLHFCAPETRPRSHSISDSQNPCSCQHTYSWPWSSLPALAPHTTTYVFAIGLTTTQKPAASSHSQTYVYHQFQSLPLLVLVSNYWAWI